MGLLYPIAKNWLKLETFAVVPRETEQFCLVKMGDIDNLRRLFVTWLAGPQDRDPDGNILLHISSLVLVEPLEQRQNIQKELKTACAIVKGNLKRPLSAETIPW